MSLGSSSSSALGPGSNPFRCRVSQSFISAKSRRKSNIFEELETCWAHLRTISYYCDKIKQGIRLSEGCPKPKDFVREWDLDTYFVDPAIVHNRTYPIEKLAFEPHNDPVLKFDNVPPPRTDYIGLSLDQISVIVEVEFFKLISHMQAIYLSLEDLSKRFTHQVLFQLAKISASDRAAAVLQSYHQNLLHLETRDSYNDTCYRIDRMLENDNGLIFCTDWQLPWWKGYTMQTSICFGI